MSTMAQTSAITPTLGPRPTVHVRHSNSTAWTPKATTTLVEAFEADPAINYMLNHLPSSARLDALHTLFTLSSNASIMAGGELWSASIVPEASKTTTDNDSVDNIPDFQASATIFPPNTTINTLSYSSLPSLLWSGGLFSAISQVGLFQFKNIMDAYAAATTPAKKSTLRSGESYYYIMLIGAASAHRGKGLAPALIRKLQERAQKDGKPIWLEASNLGARKVYLKVGFVEVGEIRLGKGECTADGEVSSGEEAVGVPMWPMVWWPEGYMRKAA